MLKFSWHKQAGLLICPRCEKPLGPEHDAEGCERKGLTRRVFFGILSGAAAVAAAQPLMAASGLPVSGIAIARRAVDPDLGLSIRLIRSYDDAGSWFSMGGPLRDLLVRQFGETPLYRQGIEIAKLPIPCAMTRDGPLRRAILTGAGSEAE